MAFKSLETFFSIAYSILHIANFGGSFMQIGDYSNPWKIGKVQRRFSSRCKLCATIQYIRLTKRISKNWCERNLVNVLHNAWQFCSTVTYWASWFREQCYIEVWQCGDALHQAANVTKHAFSQGLTVEKSVSLKDGLCRNVCASLNRAGIICRGSNSTCSNFAA
jgi:hypothetical protein